MGGLALPPWIPIRLSFHRILDFCTFSIFVFGSSWPVSRLCVNTWTTFSSCFSPTLKWGTFLERWGHSCPATTKYLLAPTARSWMQDTVQVRKSYGERRHGQSWGGKGQKRERMRTRRVKWKKWSDCGNLPEKPCLNLVIWPVGEHILIKLAVGITSPRLMGYCFLAMQSL